MDFFLFCFAFVFFLFFFSSANLTNWAVDVLFFFSALPAPMKLDKTHFRECLVETLTDMFGPECISLTRGENMSVTVDDKTALINLSTLVKIWPLIATHWVVGRMVISEHRSHRSRVFVVQLPQQSWHSVFLYRMFTVMKTTLYNKWFRQPSKSWMKPLHQSKRSICLYFRRNENKQTKKNIHICQSQILFMYAVPKRFEETCVPSGWSCWVRWCIEKYSVGDFSNDTS